MNDSVQQNSILRLKNIAVSMGNYRLLKDINLDVTRGEIHAILGPHGSGKTLLVKLVNGLIKQSNGDIFFENSKLRRISPEICSKIGIAVIPQELNLFNEISTFQNIFLTRYIKKNILFYDHKKLTNIIKSVFRELKIDIDINAPVNRFDTSTKQLLQIAKSICFPSKLLIVDEITSKLTPEAFERFRYVLSIMRQRGTTILYVTHNMDEVFNFATKVTLLREGRVIETRDISNIDKLKLVQLTYANMYNLRELERDNFELFYLKNFYEEIVNNLPLPILIANARDEIVIINVSFSCIFNLEKERYIGQNYREIINISDEVFNDVKEKILKVEKADILCPVSIFEKQEKFSISFRPFLFSDSPTIYTMIYISSNNSMQGSPNPIDIYEKENNSWNSVNWIAHEIKNPLSIMQNYLNIIKTEESLEKIYENVIYVQEEIRRINKIITNLMSSKRNKLEEDGKYSLNRIIKESVSSITPVLESKKIKQEVFLKREFDMILNNELIKQAVLNILINAVEAMPNGGVLTIYEKARTTGNKKTIYLYIKDSGVGIERMNLKYIFEPFFTTKRDRETRGLGLAISNDIISKLRGTISVKSTPQKGSAFRIALPSSR